MALSFFKVEFQNNCYQIVKRQIHVKIKKEERQSVPVLKKYLEKFVGQFEVLKPDVKRKHIKQLEWRTVCVYLKNQRFSCSEIILAFIQVSPHQCGEI